MARGELTPEIIAEIRETIGGTTKNCRDVFFYRGNGRSLWVKAIFSDGTEVMVGKEIVMLEVEPDDEVPIIPETPAAKQRTTGRPQGRPRIRLPEDELVGSSCRQVARTLVSKGYKVSRETVRRRMQEEV